MAIVTALTEESVCCLWHTQRFRKDTLACIDGVAVHCVYRGRWRHRGGPDFVDALLAFDGGDLRRGDVEVHVRSADWFAHRHHLDHAYDQVILHVVMHHDGTVARKAGGETVPTLALEEYLEEPLEAYQQPFRALPALELEPCRRAFSSRGSGYVALILDRLGQRRFEERVARFEGDLAAGEPQQVLYSAFLEALGYSENRRPFQQLAAILPWAHLENFLLSQPTSARLATAQALLFGAAGLLPSQRERRATPPGDDGGYAERLEELWASHAPAWEGLSLRAAWRYSGARPTNHPARRVAAAAHYFATVAPVGFGTSVEAVVRPTPAPQLPTALRHHFLTASRADGYWASRYDLGRPLRSTQPHLIGAARAADIVVNVVLPFLVAGANGGLARRYGQAALEAYRRHPRLADNEITRLFGGLLGDGTRAVVSSAQRQQGLLHLYYRFCREQLCQECPLGQV